MMTADGLINRYAQPTIDRFFLEMANREVDPIPEDCVYVCPANDPITDTISELNTLLGNPSYKSCIPNFINEIKINTGFIKPMAQASAHATPTTEKPPSTHSFSEVNVLGTKSQDEVVGEEEDLILLR